MWRRPTRQEQPHMVPSRQFRRWFNVESTSKNCWKNVRIFRHSTSRRKSPAWNSDVRRRIFQRFLFGVEKTSKKCCKIDVRKSIQRRILTVPVVGIGKYVIIQYNRFNSEAKDNMLAKGRKCVYSLIHKVVNHNLDFKTAMHVFDHAAVPIILYGSELWNMPDISSKRFHSQKYRKWPKWREMAPWTL